MTNPRDRQRMRKSYPFYKRRPEFQSDGDVTQEEVIRDMNIQTFTIFAGTRESVAVSGTKDSIGMTFYNGSKFNVDPSQLQFFFRAIFATNQTGSLAYVDLYDYGGLFGVPNPVAGTVLTGSTLVITQYEANVTSFFSGFTGSGIIEARIWLDSSGSANTCVVKNARLDVEWP